MNVQITLYFVPMGTWGALLDGIDCIRKAQRKSGIGPSNRAIDSQERLCAARITSNRRRTCKISSSPASFTMFTTRISLFCSIGPVNGMSVGKIAGIVHSHQGVIRMLQVGMKSSLLATLPTELVFRILDFMGPDEMSGLSCACRHSLLLVNLKLDTPEGYQLYPLESYTSCTGAFIAVGGANLERFLAENGSTNGCHAAWAFLDNESDSDLYVDSRQPKKCMASRCRL